MIDFDLAENFTHIKDIIKLADDCKFQDIISSIENKKIKKFFPFSLYKAILERLKDPQNGSFIWSKYFEDLFKNYNPELLYSTIVNNGTFNNNHLDVFFKRHGNGTLRIGADFEFVTMGDENIFLESSTIPPHKCCLINFLGSFPSNVNDNFYLILKDDKNNESFRFSNTSVSYCNDGILIECNTKVPKLYTFSIDSEYIDLYINGVLSLRKKSKITNVNKVKIGLIGSPGADLSGIMHLLEVWLLSKSFKGFFKYDDTIYYIMLEECLQQSDLLATSELLQLRDDIVIEGRLKEQFLKELSKELDRKGFREWIFDNLLSLLPEEDVYRWKEMHIKRFPEPLLQVENLTVRFYRLPNKRFSILNLLKKDRLKAFNVLDNINFKVYPGDIVGIIGPNGAGKSTLLKTIAGLIPITEGKIILKGHHQLLSPGLGIRNELSGRENIYLAGCFLGLKRKEVDNIIDEIIEFSELEEFIDQPFKFYSDGMKSRLIFSIATSIAPEILMLDELLSAGDIKFQEKAAKRMDELIERAKAVIVVTHSLTFVSQKCNKALFISKGKLKYYGNPKSAIAHYLNEEHITSQESLEDITSLNLSILQQITQQSSISEINR